MKFILNNKKFIFFVDPYFNAPVANMMQPFSAPPWQNQNYAMPMMPLQKIKYKEDGNINFKLIFFYMTFLIFQVFQCS